MPDLKVQPSAQTRGPDWSLGAGPFDELLPGGLARDGVHEIKGGVIDASGSSPSPSTSSALFFKSHTAGAGRSGASAGDWLAGLGFALRLALRRTACAKGPPPWLLWCWPRLLRNEFGVLSAAGLASFGFDPARVILVETARVSDALNAMEEALKSRSLGIVAGVFDDVGLTPARRLSLAAASGNTPCLLVTHPAGPPAGATATRWRVHRKASEEALFDARAPGAQSFNVSLERCRSAPGLTARPPLPLIWCSDACRFNLVSGVADHTAGARRVA